MRRVEQMAEEFGQYNFNFIYYVIQKAEITDNTLIIANCAGEQSLLRSLTTAERSSSVARRSRTAGF